MPPDLGGIPSSVAYSMGTCHYSPNFSNDLIFKMAIWTQLNDICKELRASLVAQMVKNLPAMQTTWIWSLGWEDPLEKAMATCSSILAWRIPWTEQPGGLQSMGVTKNWTQLSDKYLLKELSPIPGYGNVLCSTDEICYQWKWKRRVKKLA